MSLMMQFQQQPNTAFVPTAGYSRRVDIDPNDLDLFDMDNNEEDRAVEARMNDALLENNAGGKPVRVLNGYTVDDVQRVMDMIPKNKGGGSTAKEYPTLIYRNIEKNKGWIEMYRSTDGDDIGTIAIEVVPEARGTGVGTKLVKGAISAMSKLNIDRIEWYCKKTNVASIRLAERCGFVKEPKLSNKTDWTLYYGSELNESVHHVDFDFPNHTWKTGELKSHDVSAIRNDTDNRSILDDRETTVPEESNLETRPIHRPMPSEVVNYYNESTQWFSKPNLELNVDAFEGGSDNVLMITGISGGGKSTLAEELAKQYGAEIINMDIVQRFYIDGPDEVRSWSEEKLKRNRIHIHPFDFEFYDAHPEIPWGRIPKEDAWTKTDYLFWLIDRCHAEPKRRFIVDGAVIAYVDPEFLRNRPLIIVGTGALRAHWRRSMRLTKNRGTFVEWITSVAKGLEKMTHIKNMGVAAERTSNLRSALEETCPSSIPEYYAETALKAKDRNALPDSEFGIPRLRAYPLHDASHVKQAIRMFGHCKDPKDRDLLAKRIFAAAKKHDVIVKVGKENPLYDYAPEDLRESSEDAIPYGAFGVSGKPIERRTKEDVVREHLSQNSILYNGVIYNPEFAKAIQNIEPDSLTRYFYPHLGRLGFHARLNSMLGGLASRDNVRTMYGFLGIEDPYTEYASEMRIGYVNLGGDDDTQEEFRNYIVSCYSADANWFKVDLGDDVNHIYYCLRLYSIMNAIINNPYFAQKTCLKPEHLGILMDWNSRVWVNYDMYRRCVEEGDGRSALRYAQYLYDLCWPVSLNPYDEGDVATCVIDFTSRMASTKEGSLLLSEGEEMLSRENLTGYLMHDLGMPDDCYLIPSKCQYPVIDRTSIEVAMCNVGNVDPDDIKEFAENLNRKYRELGCTFSISVDHPYAKYADRAIVNNMTRILLEGDTGVDDQGTSSGRPPTSERSTYKPWYSRSDVTHGMEINMLDNKEMGPNTKRQQKPDFTPHDYIL